MATQREKWDARYAAQELVWSAGPNATLAEEVANLPAGRALDAGCGEGRNALWLAAQGWHVTAIDFSDVAVAKARQIAERRGVRVNWRVDDLSTCALDHESYDLVVVVFLHTDPATRAQWLPRLLNAVKVGGTFLYIGHDPSNIEHGTGGPRNPAFLPDATTLAAELAAFEIAIATVVQRPLSAEPGHGGNAEQRALDTLVRAVRVQ